MAIGHPFNPPHLIPLVEVVGGRETAPETVAWCLEFYRAYRQAADPYPQGGRRASGEPPAGGTVAGGGQRGGHRPGIGGGRGHRDHRRARPALGDLRAAHDVPSGRRGGRHARIMLAQFKPAFEAWWRTMETPALSDAVCRQIIDGVNDEARGPRHRCAGARARCVAGGIARSIAARPQFRRVGAGDEGNKPPPLATSPLWGAGGRGRTRFSATIRPLLPSPSRKERGSPLLLPTSSFVRGIVSVSRLTSPIRS